MTTKTFFFSGRLLKTFVLLVILLGLPRPGRSQDETGLRRRTSFDADWRFQRGDPAGLGEELSYARLKAGLIASTAGFITGATEPPPAPIGENVSYVQPGFNDKEWLSLNLPHDWGIAGPFEQKLPGATGKLPWAGVGWYRKHFQTPASLAEPGTRRLYLDIDGAMAYAAVWCNGRFVGGWPYGYSSFELDLTPFLKSDGENVLAVRLDNPPESSRWYPGSGLYRHVWLVETPALHLAHWGTQVTTPEVTPETATVRVATSLENSAGTAQDATVRTEIFACGPDGQATGKPVGTFPAAQKHLEPASRQTFAVSASVPNPQLWDVDHPGRYTAVTTVSMDGHPVDREETVFGIRSLQFTADNGFLLNGKRVQIHGVCDHHDLGALGTAVNYEALERQLTLLKEMGCNALRTSHNPPDPELLDLCDRMGFLVMDEAFDCWQTGKNPNDYHLLFDDWHDKDLRALVRRDRNHPSVILWSIGNEVPDQSTPQGPALAASLTRIVHEEDTTRLTTMACDKIPSGYNDMHKGVDVFGYNYKPDEYRKFHAANPTQPLIGSETSSGYSSRGKYYFPVSQERTAGAVDFQVSSYDHSYEYWATGPEREFKGEAEAPFVAGEFVWTGFDYLGEPTPYGDDAEGPFHFTDPLLETYNGEVTQDVGKPVLPSRSSYFGVIDLAGFPKDRSYLYQAHWRPEFPMAHLLPDWTWPGREGQVTPVDVYTSGDEAELFLNGESLGRKHTSPGQYRLEWNDVKYAPGELKVVAYKDGRPWAGDQLRTAAAPAKILLQAESFPRLAGHTQDLVYVSATIADAQGVPVPAAANLVHFSVTGGAEVVATDNGDAIDQTKFQNPARHAFSGRCLAILRLKPGAAGTITVRAETAGLPVAEQQINE